MEAGPVISKEDKPAISKEEFQAVFNASRPWREVCSSKNPGERLEKIKRLLEAGVDPNMKIPVRNFPGCGVTTPLQWAAAGGLRSEVSYLLAYGADLSVQDGNGETALFKAFDEYRRQGLFKITHISTPDMSIVKLLLLQGANPHQKNNAGRSVLDVIDERDIELSEMLGDFETYKYNHPSEFYAIEYDFDIFRIQLEFEKRKKLRGFWNTIRGIREFRHPALPDADKQEIDERSSDNPELHSPRHHGSPPEDVLRAPKRKRRDRDDDGSDGGDNRGSKFRVISPE